VQARGTCGSLSLSKRTSTGILYFLDIPNQSVLLFGAITSEITPEKVKIAMETVPWVKVTPWTKEQILDSNLSKRSSSII
jgi:hypothetical protein